MRSSAPGSVRLLDSGDARIRFAVSWPLVLGDLRRRDEAEGETGIGDRTAELHRQWELAGPDRQLVVLVVVARRSCPHLGRRLVDRDRQQERRLQLVLV